MGQTQKGRYVGTSGKRSILTERGVKPEELQEDIAKLPADVRVVLLYRLGMAQTIPNALSVRETARLLSLSTQKVEAQFNLGLGMLREKYLNRPTTRLGRARQALGVDEVTA